MPATQTAIDLTTLLKGIPAGAWVAISANADRVVSYGAELRSVLEEAKAKGEDQPIVTRVPETSAAFIL
jgi:hypothetical protein